MLLVSLSLGLAAVPTAVARRTSGTSSLLAWGWNSYGQLGDRKTTQRDLPVKVKMPEATKLAAGSNGFHSLALVHHA